MDFSKILKDIKTLAIVCLQWGDTGKGKIVDLFAQYFDIIIRGQGGDNAGHTVVVDKEKLIFHLIPSGILHDKDGKINALGPGVVFNPRTFCKELDMLEEKKLSYNNLMVSLNAKLILPQHLVLDRISEDGLGSLSIGSTGRGIAPAYGDHYLRKGLIVNDLLNKNLFVKKLKGNLQEKIRFLKTYDIKVIKKVMSHEHLLNGSYFNPKNIFDIDAIVEQYIKYGDRLKELIRDTCSVIRESVNVKKILLEGAQGNLLSIDYGTYPYVSSSDCSTKGLIKGAGLHEKEVGLIIGIIKGFYETRVGNGSFPTEFGGSASEEWCKTKTRKDEEKLYLYLSVNTTDEFEKGIAIREAGSEYGATTGRPRRTGRLDIPLLRRALLTSLSNDLALTKLDVLNNCKEIEICTHYIYNGPDYNLGNKILREGDPIYTAILEDCVLKHCKPIYKIFSGWECDLSEGFLDNFNNILDYLKKKLNVNLKIISIGADRNETVFL